MKTVVLFAIVIVSLLVLAGCARQPFVDEDSEEEIDLLKEIQEIEAELEKSESEDEADAVDEAVEEVAEELEDAEEETTEEGEEEAEEEPAEEADTSDLQVLTVEETDLVSLEVEASDEDADQITYSFSAPVDENGEWQTDYGDAGEYIITVTASDGENTVENEVLLVVKKNNVPPTIKGLPDKIEVDEGETVTLEPNVTDRNKDEVIIGFTAPFDEDGVFETDHTSAGEYEVTVTASDGEESIDVTLILIVNDVNVPPELSGLEEAITVDEGETVTIEPEVSDLDEDEVELSISEPVGDDGVWETGYTDHGEYVVTVTASDGKDTVSKEITLIVNDVNVPPRITGIKLG